MPEDDGLRALDQLTLHDLESIRMLLRGGSVIDWRRLNFGSEAAVRSFLRASGFDYDLPSDRARIEAVKSSAIAYLKRNFDFPVPRAVAELSFLELALLASSSRVHRQICACSILKVMHIIHHLEARELLFMLPISDLELFHLVEQRVYREIGTMLARGFPIIEFIGGRKNKDSLYTKLLSKRETHAAQIYDKLRFRLVTRAPDDIFPVLNYLMRSVFPFNYVVPQESTNTLFPFRRYCEGHPHLRSLLPHLQLPVHLEDDELKNDNTFSAPSYRVVHFIVDMPVRLPQEVLDQAPPAAWALGPVIFGQTEVQIIDRESEQENEIGDASHDAYKKRQQEAVLRRILAGMELPDRDPRSEAPPPTAAAAAASEVVIPAAALLPSLEDAEDPAQKKIR